MEYIEGLNEEPTPAAAPAPAGSESPPDGEYNHFRRRASVGGPVKKKEKWTKMSEEEGRATVAAVQQRVAKWAEEGEPCVPLDGWLTMMKDASENYAHVTLDGEQVGGSPFALSVRSAAAVGGACEVWGDALGGTLVAGGRAHFALRMRDEYGNVSAGHAGLLTATITPPVAPPTPAGDDDDAPAAASNAQAAVCELGEEEEGAVVSGHVSASMAGEHTLRLALAGEPLPRAPFALTVCPAPAHAPSCELSQPPHGIAAGELVRLRVVARDRYGNLQVEGGDFHLWVKGPQRALEQEVRHLGNGEYELRARLPLSGEYEIHVTLHKAHVRGSPIAMLVHPSSPGGTPLPPPPAPTPVPVAGTPPTARSPVRSPPVRSPPVRSPARPSR